MCKTESWVTVLNMVPTEHMETSKGARAESCVVAWLCECLWDWLFSNSFLLQLNPTLAFLANRTGHQLVAQTLSSRIPASSQQQTLCQQ